jgi:integral membrane protein (TIGR01906 family)
MTPSQFLKNTTRALFVFSLFLLFGTISLRWLVSDTGWYRAGFLKNDVAAATGIQFTDLSQAADQISRYLLLESDRVDDIAVKVQGRLQPLFRERENLHMRDVQSLLRGFYNLQVAAFAYTLLHLFVAAWRTRGGFWRILGSGLRSAGMLTLGLFGVFGLLSLVDFDAMFLQFHLISFDNDLWQLDPTRDNLIRMFPQGFWYESALRLALATVGQAAVAIVVGTLLTRLSPASEAMPQAGTLVHEQVL